MGIESAKTGKLIYHLTSIDNLDSIIERGLLSRRQLNNDETGFTDVANHEILDRRENLGLDACVPFHFHPFSSFDYVVKARNPYGSMMYITVKREAARENGFKIIPTHPLSADEEYSVYDYDEGFELIDWDTLTDPDATDHAAQLVKMAECLSPDAVGFDMISCIYVANEEAAGRVREKLNAAGIRCFVNLQPSWFDYVVPEAAPAENGDGGKLLYHLTPLANLDSILNHGLLSRRELISSQIDFENVSQHENIVRDREQGLDAYVTFHFNTKSASDYTIKQTYDRDLIYLTVRREDAAEHGFKVQPRPTADGAIKDYDEGFNAIDWAVMQDKDNITSYARAVRMSMALCPERVPASLIFNVFVPNEAAKTAVEEKFNAAGLHVYVKVMGYWFPARRRRR